MYIPAAPMGIYLATDPSQTITTAYHTNLEVLIFLFSLRDTQNTPQWLIRNGDDHVKAIQRRSYRHRHRVSWATAATSNSHFRQCTHISSFQ